MMGFRVGLLLVAAAGILAALPAQAGSMRCGSRLVDEGSQAAELLSICGEPALRDYWQTPLPHGGYVADVEVWVYDFGPNQLLQLVQLRNGRIAEIESDGYGFLPNSSGGCEPRRITEGLSKYRLLRLCGEPLTRRAESLLVPYTPRRDVYRPGYDPYAGGRQFLVPTYREEWVYNFGPRSAMRLVVLDDGKVSNVEQLERGFEPRGNSR